MLIDDFLERGDKIALAALPPFQVANFFCQLECARILLDVDQRADKLRDFGDTLDVFFIELPDNGLGFGRTLKGKQRPGIDLSRLIAALRLRGQRLRDSQGCGAITAAQKRLRVGQRNLQISGIKLISALKPTMAIAVGSALQLASLEKSAGRGFALA